MDRREIIWTDDAKADLKGIFEYWDAHNASSSFSTKLLKEFDQRARQLSTLPFIGKTTEVESVRYVIVRQFAITYHIGENTIHILSVWDERRDPATRPVQTEL